ncbi:MULTISPECIES: hypothetical protein [unclassified Streptomyces]|uniref:hypothetical protein n=1 Tax=unclassified Streptomyces TaxID=2593676 RepID=UPI00099DB05A|nr:MULTISPECIES: hypothetical protein [unclassified Streptomyces]
MPLPPKCPTTDCDAWLWKDTTQTSTDWDNWRWWCCRCQKQWYPTAEQLGEFRHGASSGPGGPGGPGRQPRAAAYRDPRVAAARP